VGRITRAHGIRGELKVEVWSDVESRFAVGHEFLLKPHPASGLRPRMRRITSVRPDKGTLLVRFEGIEDRDSAEPLRGAVLEVDEAEVPKPPEGFYYHFQLVGCRLEDRRDGDLGQVVEVIEDGGGHILRVEKKTDGKLVAVLVPFVDAFLSRVDIEAKHIDVELPPGLIETCTSKR